MEEDRLRERFYGISFHIFNFEPYISFLFKRREKEDGLVLTLPLIYILVRMSVCIYLYMMGRRRFLEL